MFTHEKGRARAKPHRFTLAEGNVTWIDWQDARRTKGRQIQKGEGLPPFCLHSILPINPSDMSESVWLCPCPTHFMYKHGLQSSIPSFGKKNLFRGEKLHMQVLSAIKKDFNGFHTFPVRNSNWVPCFFFVFYTGVPYSFRTLPVRDSSWVPYFFF